MEEEVDLHGLGIKNIIGVINKYHGRYIIEEKGKIAGKTGKKRSAAWYPEAGK